MISPSQPPLPSALPCTVTDQPFSPRDMQVASTDFNAMCGHGAFAAALEMEVCRGMQFFDAGGFVNIPIMESALRKAGKIPGLMPGWAGREGVALTIIQFLGSWMLPEVPAAARCRYRHWVATRGDLIWDCNAGQWLPRAEWEYVVKALLPRRSTGYEAFRSIVWQDATR